MIGATISVCITVVVVVAIVLGLSLGTCAHVNREYQETVRACITAGGQWVPQWTQEGSCIRSH